MKLLVTAPSGAQELIEVGEGGGYFDPARVLWKESDGPMPAELQASLAAADKQRARDAAWDGIKEKRDSLSDQGGYLVSGKWFHSDAKSKTQQLALARKADKVQAAGGDMAAQFTGNAGFWKTMDGTFVAMTGALAQAIADAAELQDGAIFAAAETHKTAMEASADPAAYDFSGGWPGTFPG